LSKCHEELASKQSMDSLSPSFWYIIFIKQCYLFVGLSIEARF
jgi:hypothetical protein